jgi:hypothetical protein
MPSFFFSGAVKAKELIQSTFRQLPLFLIGTLFILGLMETNVAYLFFVIGSFCFLSGTWLLQSILSMIINKINKPSITDLFMSPNGNMLGCSILGTSDRAAAMAGGSTMVSPSYFIGYLAFFFTYIFLNALALYNRTGDVSDSNKEVAEKVDNRKYQAGMSMFICVLFFIVFSLVRLIKFKQCERTIFGAVLGTGLGIGFAYSWNQLLNVCGGATLSDMFGILGRLVPPDTKNTNPVACVVSA